MMFFDNYIKLDSSVKFRNVNSIKSDVIYSDEIKYYNIALNKLIFEDEIIFIHYKYNEDFISFCKRNAIKEVNFFDIWYHLWLVSDYDFLSDEGVSVMKLFERFGYSSSEVFDLLDKYRCRFYNSDEYGSIDCFQILSSFIFISKKEYNEVMDITMDAFRRGLNAGY